MPHTYTIKARTFDARYTSDKDQKDIFNANILTSEYGFDDKVALCCDDKPFAVFSTAKAAQDWLEDNKEEFESPQE